MRQLNPSSNLILAVLAGLGLLASLSLSWYAAPAEPPNPDDGPIERGAWQVGYVFATSARGQVEGGDAIGDGRLFLVAAVVLIAILGLAISLNAGRQGAEGLLRGVALSVPVLVIGLALVHPGTDAPVRVHYGMVIALGIAALTASAAWHGASWRPKHAPPVRRAFSR